MMVIKAYPKTTTVKEITAMAGVFLGFAKKTNKSRSINKVHINKDMFISNDLQ